MTARKGLPEIPEVFDALEAVVVAHFDRNGDLKYRNAGFARLAERTGIAPAQMFAQPRFDELLSVEPDADSVVYAGRVMLGDPHGVTYTVVGNVFASGGDVLLVGGVDVDEFERTAELGTRRQLDKVLATELDRARRYGAPLSIALLDLDRFKAFKDEHGHEAGDTVLQVIGRFLAGTVRLTDVAASFGGEAFVIVMPGVGLDGAERAIERIRAALADLEFENLPSVTASCGVVELRKDEAAASLLARAESATHRAKEAGGNRVSAAD